MDNEKLIASFAEFAASRNVNRETVIHMLDEVLRTLVQKKYGSSTNSHIVVNPEKGDLQIWRYRQIVSDDSEDVGKGDNITLSEAHKLEPDFEVGEEVAEEIDIKVFGRRAVVQAFQVLTKRIQELERDNLYKRYKSQEGELIYAEVYYLSPRVAILYDNDRNELILPKEHQIPNERYRKGGHIHALIHQVEKQDGGKPRIILSRTSPLFLQRTLENQIDELVDGIIKVKKVVRRPGERAKVVVVTNDDRVDPVGACIGPRGQRIKSICQRELWNEQVDVISHTDNEDLYIKRALSPAQVHSIQKFGERIAVYLRAEQVPLAIGTNGQNIDLASQLIGKPIDVYRELVKGQEVETEEREDNNSQKINTN